MSDQLCDHLSFILRRRRGISNSLSELLVICQGGNLAGTALKSPALLFNPNTFVSLESGSAVELRNLGYNTWSGLASPAGHLRSKASWFPQLFSGRERKRCLWEARRGSLNSVFLRTRRATSRASADAGQPRQCAALPRARARPDLLASKRAAERTIRPARRGCRRDSRAREPPAAPGPPPPAGSQSA